MSNLLAIESNFLRLPEVATALQLTNIRSIQRTMMSGQKKKFTQSLTLADHVAKAYQWFQSPEGKLKLADEGIEWTSEEFASKVFGWQKSYFYKVVKASKVNEEVVNKFNEKCDEVEANGQEPNRSIEGLLKFAKVVETATAEGGEGGEGEEGEVAEAEVETRSETIFTLTFKQPDGNISVRINALGELKTTNTRSQIEEAVAFLLSQLP